MEDGLLNIGEFWNLKENKLLVDVLGFDLKGINNNVDSRNERTNLINKVLEDQLTGAIRNHEMWLKETFIPLQAFKL